MANNNRNALNLAGILLLLVVLGCACPTKILELAKKKEPPPSSTPESIETDDPDNATPMPRSGGDGELTMAKYKQINIGLPRADVERILGGKGTEISSSTGGGMRFSVNKWEGEKYMSIILSFKNDKVMTKAQVGLK